MAGASFVAELGAKELFGKDRPEGGAVEGDFMRGRGTHDPGLNPNAYPMTDATRYPSAVRVLVNGVPAGSLRPAGRPGRPPRPPVLARAEAGREAPGGGLLRVPRVRVRSRRRRLREAAAAGEVVVRLEVDEALPGGLAIYGEGAGRYPLDPSLVLTLRR